jgi:hypothetical protein
MSKIQRNGLSLLQNQLRSEFTFLGDQDIHEICQYLCSEQSGNDGNDDPILLVEFLPPIGNVNNEAGFDVNRSAVIAAFVSNGAMDVGGHGHAFKFDSWDDLEVAKQNMRDPTVVGNGHWAL